MTSASWIPLPGATPFPLENLPLGAFVRDGDPAARLGIAIGDHVLDLAAASAAGLFDDVLPRARDLLARPTWNDCFAEGRAAVRSVRARAHALLAAGGRERLEAAGVERAIVRERDVRLVLPVAPGDYVDFYASIDHATRVGEIFRPGEPPLPPQYRSLPIGYHGRAGSIVVSGTPVVRPVGQSLRDGRVVVAPSAMLDYEFELAFVTAAGPALGSPVPLARARDLVVGVALLNDWSARDLQSWEYRPLGPFLGKSFATSLGAWIVTLDALEPYGVPGPPQEPEPPAYLREAEPRALDVRGEITWRRGTTERVVARPRADQLYWSSAQMLAHLTSNGACVRAGDLFATGTISSRAADGRLEAGSALERGEGFLEDGDEIVLRAWAGDGSPGRPVLGFGDLRGRIEPARSG